MSAVGDAVPLLMRRNSAARSEGNSRLISWASVTGEIYDIMTLTTRRRDGRNA